MDTALILRQKFDRSELVTEKEIDILLKQSQIVEKLLVDYEDKPLFNIFRLICLSEIPYVDRLSYTKKILSYVSKNLALPQGFSYTGKVNDIVPCYNAMLLEAYIKLGKEESKEVKNALNWIKQYQVFERNSSTSWKQNGICKHGGCMKSTPCYIGIGKTIRALITYAEYTNNVDKEVEDLIDKGTKYMLKHNMYLRLTSKRPISKNITSIMFPQAYMLTLTDLVYICGKRNLWEHKESHLLRELLVEKSYEESTWKIDYIYSHKGFKTFDGKRYPSEWINYLFQKSLGLSE